MANINEKLLEVKKQINPIVKTETNPFLKSKFFDINALIEQIEPILIENGFLLTQPIEAGSVKTTLTHVESGESITSAIELPKIDDPQKLGSAITYYRRYTLQSLLALQAIDDDGHAAADDIARMRQQAEDLLDGSVWADDKRTYQTALHRINNYGVDDLKRAIAELKENQRPVERKSMKEINDIVKGKADAKD